MRLALLALPIRPNTGRLRPLVPEVTSIVFAPRGGATWSATPASAPSRLTSTARLGPTGGRLTCWDLTRGVAITGKMPKLSAVVALHACPGHGRVTVDTPVSSFPLIRDINPRRESMCVRLAATSFGWGLTLKSRRGLNDVLQSMVLVDSSE